MSDFDTYVLLLCLTVFIALTVFFAILIARDVKSTLKMIAGGLLDEEIINEQRKIKAKRKKSVAVIIIAKALSVLFALVIFFALGFSVYLKTSEKNTVKSIPSVRVVESGSMATIHEKNKYIAENRLSDQIKRFDLITLHALPDESDLKLYDIVAYESNGILIIHRIVSITEPDETHSERFFLLQGDANLYPDKFPVKYSQMKGIYRGERVSFLGSFVVFMQSPAGYLCFGAIIFTCAAYPFLAKKINAATTRRIGVLENSTEKKFDSEEKKEPERTVIPDTPQRQNKKPAAKDAENRRSDTTKNDKKVTKK